ncbi:hypothetical protein ACHAWF_000808 [Thalassiosira exigua]
MRYTDVDYDVFSDAAEHTACGQSPYARHTYQGDSWAVLLTRYFGNIIFCVVDVVCGHIIALLRRRGRRLSRASGYPGGGAHGGGKKWLALSPELKDAFCGGCTAFYQSTSARGGPLKV